MAQDLNEADKMDDDDHERNDELDSLKHIHKNLFFSLLPGEVIFLARRDRTADRAVNNFCN